MLLRFAVKVSQSGRTGISLCKPCCLLVCFFCIRRAALSRFYSLFWLFTQRLVFPGRVAARWVVLFFLLATYSDFLINDLENAIGAALLNFGIFFLVGMIGYSIRQTELSRRTNQQLLEALQTAQAQLQDLAIAKERNRLAREIHDGLGHYLTATTMQIQGARALLENIPDIPQPIAVLNALSKAETLLQEALADVRHSVAALRTAPTATKPLSAAIQRFGS